ncbi:MAG: methylenetetrahydrofolate reductase [NAD(P)H] [Bacteroidaceae bacterium]|nr:methylenetetrahydrofolate reductase [NAD(P)H] [Bacteroidaceae bacterium]
MKVIELIKDKTSQPFSFEVLPPLKGSGTEGLFQTIDRLREFAPRYINITAHRSEYVYKELENGLMQRQRIRRRPGSIAIAAAIQQRYGIPVVPHLVCSGNTREDLEYTLIDLQFLDISDLLVLRGDKAKDEASFQPTGDGPAHATELIQQINRFNQGEFFDGTPIKNPGKPFSFGVACYPEKHEEAANLESDMAVLKQKADLGAEYAVTQLFYDNEKYFSFVRKAREMGITIPIVPGIKPLAKFSQLTIVPKSFHCDLPEALYREAAKCKTDEEMKQVGIEWATAQCKELLAKGAPNLHFYTVSAVDSICQIAKNIY